MNREIRAKWIWRITLFLFFGLVAWLPLAWALGNYLVVEKPLERADAILILSGSAEYRERAQEAAKLYRQGIAPRIFLTNDGMKGGWNQKEQRNPFFVERASWELVDQGVPKEAIEVIQGKNSGTDDEAELLAKAAASKELKSLLIVTSAYHSRRTLWTFERTLSKNGIQLNIGISSPPITERTPPAFDWWLSSRGWKIVITEYAKIAYYRIKN